LNSLGFMENATLNYHLKELVNSGLFYQKGIAPNAEFQFRHGLMQNAAYQSMLRSRRQQLHQRVGLVLTEQFPELVTIQPETAAHHFTEAGLKEQALTYWQQAAERSLKASAYVEAAHHVQKGLKLTSTIKDSDKKIQFELAFQVRNSTIVKVQDGWSSERVKKVYDKCFELCQKLEDSEELFTTLFGIWAYYVIGGNIPQSYELALKCEKMLADSKDYNILMNAQTMIGNSLFWLGEFEQADKHFEKVYEFNKLADDSKMVGFGQDARIVAYMLDNWGSWMLGNLEKAERINQQSLQLATEINHPFSSAISHCTASWYYQFCRDIEKTLFHARQCIDLGFPSYQSWGYMLEGWAMAADGQPHDGLRNVKYGFQMLKDQGAGLESYPAVLLTETAIMCKKYDLALEYIEMGLKAVDRNKEAVFEGELWRLKGITTHLQSIAGIVNADLFKKAIALSERTNSRMFSWRAANSWHILSQKNGKDKQSNIQKILAAKQSAIPTSNGKLEQIIEQEKAFIID